MKLREVEDKSVGDYLTAKSPDGPLGDGELPHHVWRTVCMSTRDYKDRKITRIYYITSNNEFISI